MLPDGFFIIGGNGSGAGGVESVADHVPAVMAKLFETMKETVGIDMAELVKAGTYDAAVTRNINITSTSSDGTGSGGTKTGGTKSEEAGEPAGQSSEE